MQKFKKYLQKLNKNVQKLKDFAKNSTYLPGPVVFQSGVQKKPAIWCADPSSSGLDLQELKKFFAHGPKGGPH